MQRSILVPVDGSSLSESALPVALAIARQRGDTSVEAVTVAPPTVFRFGGSGAPAVDTTLDHDQRAESRNFVTSLEERLRQMAPDVTTRATLVDGPVAESIATFAEHGEHDLIVMTTHGRSGLSRFWIGSVADRLLRFSRVPVLLLRTGDEDVSAPKSPPFTTVLIPIDVESRSDEIVSDVLALVGPSATLHLLHVVVPHRHVPIPALDLLRATTTVADDPRTDLLGLSRESAEQHLGALAERLRARHLQVETSVRVHHNPAEAILEYAAGVQAELISMASHGRGLAARLVLGSVTDKVVRGATVPVLVSGGPTRD